MRHHNVLCISSVLVRHKPLEDEGFVCMFHGWWVDSWSTSTNEGIFRVSPQEGLDDSRIAKKLQNETGPFSSWSSGGSSNLRCTPCRSCAQRNCALPEVLSSSQHHGEPGLFGSDEDFGRGSCLSGPNGAENEGPNGPQMGLRNPNG